MGKSRYKAIKVNGVKHDYHRWIMEQELGRKLRRDEVVHHINENPLDNDVSNLCVMSLSEHASLHQKGHIESDVSRKKRSDSMRGRPNIACRKLSNEDVEYIRNHYIPGDREFGARALSRKFGISHPHILDIVKSRHYVTLI